MTTGIVTDIVRASLQDGPGIRTVVFLKGCPLRCQWCHNPECLDFEPQELYYPEKCIGCGQCDAGCYTGARVICGRRMTVEEVMEQIRMDADYYGNSGGVTISGGEPQAQPAFLNALIDACRRDGISVAIETSMILYHPDILKKTEQILADIKIWDSQLHRQYTGAGNEKILHNLRCADTLGIPMMIRTPIIPGVNDTVENIAAIRDFLNSLKHVVAYDLLPYHPLGLSKQRALGREEVRFDIPSPECMAALRQYTNLMKKEV